MSSDDKWSGQSKRWQHVGPPTRPTDEDGKMMLELASANLQGSKTHIGMFGVTPEVVQLDWPNGASMQAFDLSVDMIRHVWSPNPQLNCQVTQADWRDIPLPESSFDLIVGDGIFTAVGSRKAVEQVFQESSRILKSDGIMILRCFVLPDNAESIEIVIKDALEGKIRHFGTLKWRLAMALVDANSQVSPSLIHSVFNDNFKSRSLLAQNTSWDIETINTIDAYEFMQGSFYFPHFDELREVACNTLGINQTLVGSYELAERFPTIRFSKDV
jgi:SAM-dependent methyltransferase